MDDDYAYQYQYNDMGGYEPATTKKQQKLQYQITQLKDRIIKQANEINDLTCLGFDWSILLYYESNWSRQKCDSWILSSDQKHKKAIRYLKESQALKSTNSKQCQVCSEKFQNNKIRNVCGHQFCSVCWKDHMYYSLIRDVNCPFPPCMMIKCPNKMCYTICLAMCQLGSQIRVLFYESLCRSYALSNKAVKMCQGRPGTKCTQCFTIQSLLKIIECQKCGTLSCPKCLQSCHGASQCQLITKWRKTNAMTLGFMEYFCLQYCPKCRMGIQRLGGCNEMVCRCGAQFCFLCGECWGDKHPINSDQYCTNYKKYWQKYKKRRLVKKQNAEICFRVQAKRQQLQVLQKMLTKIQQFRNKYDVIKKQFMKNFQFFESQLRCLDEHCVFLKKTAYILWGQAIREYYYQNKQRIFFVNQIKTPYNKIYDFIFQFVNRMYLFLTNQLQFKSQDKLLKEMQQTKAKFHKLYIQKNKQIISLKYPIMKIVKDDFNSLIYQ